MGACCADFFSHDSPPALGRRGIPDLTEQDASHPARRGGGRAVPEGGAAPAGLSAAESAGHDRHPDPAAEVTYCGRAEGGAGVRGGLGVYGLVSQASSVLLGPGTWHTLLPGPEEKPRSLPTWNSVVLMA